MTLVSMSMVVSFSLAPLRLLSLFSIGLENTSRPPSSNATTRLTWSPYIGSYGHIIIYMSPPTLVTSPHHTAWPHTWYPAPASWRPGCHSSSLCQAAAETRGDSRPHPCKHRIIIISCNNICGCRLVILSHV